MFTGIIEEVGIVDRLSKCRNISRLTLKAKIVLENTKIGDSLAVNGVCLTVVEIKKDNLSFDLALETLTKTNLGNLKRLDKLNLERSLKVGDRLSGHFLTGHVDGVGKIKKKSRSGEAVSFQIQLPSKALPYIVPKGSIAIDGISLTIADISDSSIILQTIPHTLKMTTLGFKSVGDLVNIEADLIGKYIYKFTQPLCTGARFTSHLPNKGRITEELLREHGLI